VAEVQTNPMLSTHVRFIRNAEVVSRKIEGELIIVPIRSGVGDLNSLYTLNLVGCVLWEFLNEGHTVDEMVQRVCDEFEVTTSQAQQDIEVFLNSLVEEKLVESVPEFLPAER
jgi:Coenzyme PQQ synthesis protein D (PqqD)